MHHVHNGAWSGKKVPFSHFFFVHVYSTKPQWPSELYSYVNFNVFMRIYFRNLIGFVSNAWKKFYFIVLASIQYNPNIVMFAKFTKGKTQWCMQGVMSPLPQKRLIWKTIKIQYQISTKEFKKCDAIMQAQTGNQGVMFPLCQQRES